MARSQNQDLGLPFQAFSQLSGLKLTCPPEVFHLLVSSPASTSSFTSCCCCSLHSRSASHFNRRGGPLNKYMKGTTMFSQKGRPSGPSKLPVRFSQRFIVTQLMPSKTGFPFFPKSHHVGHGSALPCVWTEVDGFQLMSHHV